MSGPKKDIYKKLLGINHNETFEIHNSDEKIGALFGNFDIDIYDEDIEALKEGKQICFFEEYGFRVHYKPGKKPNPETADFNKDNGYAWEDWPE